MELEDIVNMMFSNDYKERFKAEYFYIKIRIEKLDARLNKYKNGELDFDPYCPINLLEQQKSAMIKYMHKLEARARIENVEIG